MKKILRVLIMLSIFLMGCVEQKDIDYFLSDGVTLGAIKRNNAHQYFLPIEFELQVQQSAQWLYDVKHAVVKNEIHIWALYATPPNVKESLYQGGVLIENARKGGYQVLYINRDKSKYLIGSIVLR